MFVGHILCVQVDDMVEIEQQMHSAFIAEPSLTHATFMAEPPHAEPPPPHFTSVTQHSYETDARGSVTEGSMSYNSTHGGSSIHEPPPTPTPTAAPVTPSPAYSAPPYSASVCAAPYSYSTTSSVSSTGYGSSSLSVGARGVAGGETVGAPVTIGGIEFAGSAREAREKMKRGGKKSVAVKTSSMSYKDKYDLLQKL